ncbi:DUF1801 domain-containing protein [Undibacterium sp.]|uniref:DUF1801 domain-containing protein n=1 Tax=Undibacterium sp. TaxID=1914977 RepID=UPI003751734B
MNQRVETFLQDLSLTSDHHHQMVLVVRKLVLAIDKGVSEEIKYGGILFSAENSFCGVFAYANHISVEFGDGASMPDAFGMLEGKGKFRRHIKLTELSDVKDKQLAHYLKLAYQRDSAV